MLLLLVGLPQPSSGAEDATAPTSPRCAAAIDSAAGDYSRCLLKARGRFAKRGDAERLAKRQAKCEDQFDKRVERASSRYGADACTPYSDEIAASAVLFSEGVAAQASGEPNASPCTGQADFSGRFGHERLDYQGFDPETNEVSAGVWPEAWEFLIVAGGFESAYTLLNAETDELKAMCIARGWAPKTLECMDVDDLGIFTFQATEIGPACSVTSYIYVHRELGGSCDEVNDLNCPGLPLMSTSTGVRVAP